MTNQLREELDALADTQTFSPDPAAWDRGRRARTRGRVARGAAALAVVAIVVGVGAIVVRPDRAPVPPAGEVRGGAIPSRIDVTNGDVEEDFAIGRASVALGGNHLVLVGAEDGRYHHFEASGAVFALSPDGYRVAWWSDDGLSPDRIAIADLRTGEVTQFAHNGGRGAEVAELFWRDADRLRWRGTDPDGQDVAAEIDVTGPSESPSSSVAERPEVGGLPSPDSDVIALRSDGRTVQAVPFLEEGDGPGGSELSRGIDRPLPQGLHPDGAVVQPIGWAEDDLLVAIVDPLPSDVVERPRLAILSSPDVPESEWVYREFLTRLPPEATSFAVDLIPDLTGDPDQELTHDFSAGAQVEDEGPGLLPYALGGLAALVAGLAFVRNRQAGVKIS